MGILGGGMVFEGFLGGTFCISGVAFCGENIVTCLFLAWYGFLEQRWCFKD